AVGDAAADAVEAQRAGERAAEPISHRRRLVGTERDDDLVRPFDELRIRRHPVGEDDVRQVAWTIEGHVRPDVEFAFGPQDRNGFALIVKLAAESETRDNIVKAVSELSPFPQEPREQSQADNDDAVSGRVRERSPERDLQEQDKEKPPSAGRQHEVIDLRTM